MGFGLDNLEEVNTGNHGSTKVDYLTLEFLYSILNWDHADSYSCDLNDTKKISDQMPTNSNGRNPRATSEPRNVSIGPHHYGTPHLDRMQVDKLRALRHFVKRGGLPLDSYLQALVKLSTQFRDSYGTLDEIWQDNDRFVILMLLDGVFLLEFLSVTRGNQKYSDYAATDPIFGHEGHVLIYEVIMQDLLMHTNQVPYLVLSTLLSVSEGLPEKSIQSILSWMMFAPKIEPGLHLLDMYLKGLLAVGQRAEKEDQPQEDKNGRISISKLYHKYGVRCVRVQSYDNINFDKNTATLELPIIHINKQNAPKFVNLIIYERSTKNKELNSYFDFMGSLIQSPKDVYQLRCQGIIVNSSSSDEVVMELIKEITKETVRGDKTCTTNLVRNELNEFYQKGATNIFRRCYAILSSTLRMH
ncbi:hypothetical protein MKX03_024728 [Papaver bracteatum]|nr:hypothetical protein MKX03_024728 [Papaver bracteatum]